MNSPLTGPSHARRRRRHHGRREGTRRPRRREARPARQPPRRRRRRRQTPHHPERPRRRRPHGWWHVPKPAGPALPAGPVPPPAVPRAATAVPKFRALHSSTFHINASTFGGIVYYAPGGVSRRNGSGVRVGSLSNVPSQVRTTVVPEVPSARRWDVRRCWAVLINFGRFQRRYAPKTHLDSRFQARYGTSFKECTRIRKWTSVRPCRK